MQLNATATNVSEFLDALADQSRSQGLDNNASVYHDWAMRAKQVERRAQELEAALSDANDRLQDIARTARTAQAAES